MMLNLDCSSAYRSWFQRMSSPRWRMVGFEDERVVLDCGGIEVVGG